MPEHLIPMYNLEHRFRMSLLWGVRYQLGAKFDSIKAEHPLGHYVDCSGYIRWLIYHGSGGALLLPDGSVNQHAYIQQQLFSTRDYSKAVLNTTGAVYICFLRPTERKAGHVWLLRNGQTMESRGGKGISTRPGWQLKLLFRPIYCYRLS
jgi:cell wall-associated NlpC family hydrolase